jgi:hypothetical protein
MPLVDDGKMHNVMIEMGDRCRGSPIRHCRANRLVGTFRP